ncbi:MAG: acetate--CoA ligase [Thaumarchaeota archaeon]|nr:acetate--CoA ligase [Nitrososphaerota archaeon]
MSSEGEGSLPTNARIIPNQDYRSTWEASIKNPEQFWDSVARELYWFKTWDKVLEWNNPFARWFKGGEINVSVNAVDRHITTWRKNKVAILWEGEPGERRAVTYNEMYQEVNRFASVLKNLGVQKGDRVAFYMPMVPEFPIGVLAATRIGATFTVVFSGFSASALAGRINDCQAKVVVTADGGYRRGKVIQLKEIVDEALASTPSVQKVIVYRRVSREIPIKEGRDYWWHDLMKDSKPYVAPEPLDSLHPLYILYTSGTTGKPKGAVHSTGGYLTYVYATTKWVFDPKENDVYWCTADIGWVTGHSYVIFGPLSHGLTTVMYEGAPDYPRATRWWEIIERYGVSIFYTTPTAIRALMKFGDDLPKKHDLSSLRILGTVGEPINPAAWEWYYNIIGQTKCPIVDTWWQTETGGIMISPTPNLGIMPLKPGSATLPLPGIEPEIVDEQGNPVKLGEKGFLIIKRPWPGMFMTLYNDEDRYKQVYWSKFPGYYYPGDYALRDHDQYFWFLGRADEVLKVAGHRLGTIEIEDAFVGHRAVAEAAVAGRPDPVKGEGIVAFVTLKNNFTPSQELREELRQYVRKTIGPIATPDEIHFVSLLPKTRSGKIMRRIVKAVASGAEIGDVTTLEDGMSIEEVKKAIAEFTQSLRS